MQNSSLLLELKERLKKEIIFIDGAMGTMIQQFKLDESQFHLSPFNNHSVSLKGNNEVLNLTRPDLIKEIHFAYLEAGADIIETNTFNGTRIAQLDYLLQDSIKDINHAAAKVAREAVDQFQIKNPSRKCYVAGALGPTNKTASLSPDVNDPAFRAVSFDELVDAYYEQAEALIQGGVDILLPETTFDTLNLKACLFAIDKLEEKLSQKIPLMISVTITDKAGRTLSGQNISAFWNSIRHAQPLSVGINCALGAEEMRPFLEDLSAQADCFISLYPNAGLPNPLSPTGYDETPESISDQLQIYAIEGLVNLVGGCCGTTPAHIKAIVEKLKGISPREIPRLESLTRLSGLEALNLKSSGERPFILVGERTNVAGSPRFAKLIQGENYAEALAIARSQVENGANIIDVNFDDGMIDGVIAMTHFLNLIASEPEISKVPIMIDSSNWKVLEAGLKTTQGKCIVNSISLKEGEAEFLRQAKLAQKYGAAVVVMAFDETGQATHLSHKVEIATRAYQLLVGVLKFDPCDIIFDLNVLTIGTGLPEHNQYALDFIQGIKEVKRCCPGVLVSGGISNLSFSFRGKKQIREALHTVFLYHAIKAGLDMAIVNAGMLEIYEDIDIRLRDLCEDLIFNRNDQATDQLLSFGQVHQLKKDHVGDSVHHWRNLDIQSRITYALVKGEDHYIISDVQEVLSQQKSPLEVIEGPLMNGMKHVGDLFGQGKMFLPQVVKSARVMKKAVSFLQPLMQQGESSLSKKNRGVIILATVKGDVHDIGKNIVGVVLACNGFRVIDLGVMVSVQTIIDAIQLYQADLVGLSGLITPSLDEMIHNLKEMQRVGIKVPVLIGGATTSELHTSVKMLTHYEGPLVHVNDASLVVEACNGLLGESKNAFAQFYRDKYSLLKSKYEIESKQEPILPLSQVNQKPFIVDWNSIKIAHPSRYHVSTLKVSLEELIQFIDWGPFFWTWQLRGVYPQIFDKPDIGEQAKKLFQDAQEMLEEIRLGNWFRAQIRIGCWRAQSHQNDVSLINDEGETFYILHFLRQQRTKESIDGQFLCLADFVAPAPFQDSMGAFFVSTGSQIQDHIRDFESQHDDYKALLLKSLGDRLAEAAAEWAHLQFRKLYVYGQSEILSVPELIKEKYVGIRPAPGYPACPDHLGKKAIFDLLQIEKEFGASLTESLAIHPPSSIAGFYFPHVHSRYFHVGRIGQDQIQDLAQRAGLSPMTIKSYLSVNLMEK